MLLLVTLYQIYTNNLLRGKPLKNCPAIIYFLRAAISVLFFFLVIVLTGEIFSFLSFVGRYPYVIWNMFLFGLTSALGQVSTKNYHSKHVISTVSAQTIKDSRNSIICIVNTIFRGTLTFDGINRGEGIRYNILTNCR